MTLIFIYSLAFTVMSTAGLTFFAWKIMRMRITPTWTWSLFFIAMAIQLIQTIWGLFYANQLLAMLSGFPFSSILFSYALNAIRIGLVFTFVVRIYYELRSKFPRDL